MSAPITLLYGDIWVSIADLLNLRSILNLLSAGNAQLAAVVRQSVHRAVWKQDGPYLDIDAFFRTCKQFKSASEGLSSLKEIRIEPTELEIAVKTPLLPLFLPPTLTCLSLIFTGAISMIIPLKLSALLPQLVSLSLGGTHNGDLELEDLDLPIFLENLVFNPQGPGFPSISPKSIASLPRTLQSLSIYANRTYGSSESARPLDETFEWPSSLTELELVSITGNVTIEHLPRTLTSLDISNCSLIDTDFPRTTGGGTTFPRSNGKIVFPWRRFFPKLRNLKLPELEASTSLDLALLLRTVLLDDAISSELVDTFIASGFWDVSTLRHFQTAEGRAREPYPSYASLQLPKRVLDSLPEAFIEEELETLAPHLTNTDLVNISVTLATAAHLKATSMISVSDYELEFPGARLSNAVKTLCTPGKLLISNLPPSITHLICGQIIGTGENGAFGSSDALPPRLETLEFRYIAPHSDLMHMLPRTLVHLTVLIQAPHEWNTIAEELVNLTHLEVILLAPWSCSQTLSRVAAPHLTQFHLTLHSRLDYTLDRPKMDEFFTGQIFPPSLRGLKLAHKYSSPWHLSVLAVLPPNLTSLEIDNLTWSPSQEVPILPYPEAIGMSIADLLKCLSPTLASLTFNGDGRDRWPPSPLIELLPRSITSIELYDVFDTSDVPEGTLDAKLPPYAIRGNFGSFAVLPQDIRPTGFLN